MQTVRSVLYWYHSYFGTGGQGFIFASALAFLIITRHTRRENKKILFLSSCGILLSLICLCPLTARFLMKAITERVYWRVFWMVPIPAVLACAAVELVFMGDAKSGGANKEGSGKEDSPAGKGLRKPAVTFLCIALVAVNGTLAFSGDFFVPRENNFKLPTPVIRVADAVNAHAKEHKIRNRSKKIAAPVSVAELIRLYDASIIQAYGRTAESNPALQNTLYQEINAENPDLEVLTQEARGKKMRYLVLTDVQDDRETMEALEYEQIFCDNGYAVYFDTRFDSKKK